MQITRSLLVGLSVALAATPLPAQTETDSALTKRATLLQQTHPRAAFRIHKSRLQVRERATRTGVKWGGITGAAGGVLFGGFLGYLIDALCESECSGDVSHGALIGAALGGVSGAVAGGVTGGVIGAGIPRWSDVDEARLRRAPGYPIGAVTLTPAYAHPGTGTGGGAGARAAFVFQTSHLALGPEFGRYRLGNNVRARAGVCTGSDPLSCTDTIPSQETVTHAGFNARLGTGVERRFEPYLTVGGGFYAWARNQSLGSTQLVGYSVGAGVQLRSAHQRRAVLAETRWQNNLSHPDNPQAKYGFYTFAVGASLAW